MPLPRFLSSVTKRSFFLTHDCCQDFVLSKWSDNPLVYAVWSTICCFYVVSLVVYTAVESQYGVKILIWLTYWAYYCVALRFLITTLNGWLNILSLKSDNASPNFYSLHSEATDITQQEPDIQTPTVASATLYSEDSSSVKCLSVGGADEEVGSCGESPSVSVNTIEQNGQGKNNLKPLIAFQWFLQNISNSVSILVTILYWGLVYTGEPQDYNSINSHVITSLLITGDILMSRAPIRMQHFHMPLTYLSVYIIFTIVYWAMGGTNHKGQIFIYKVLDYSSKPGTAAIAICMIALFGVSLVQLYLYFLCRLRNALFTLKREGVLFYA